TLAGLGSFASFLLTYGSPSQVDLVRIFYPDCRWVCGSCTRFGGWPSAEYCDPTAEEDPEEGVGDRPEVVQDISCSPRGTAAGNSAGPSTAPPGCCSAPPARRRRRRPGPIPPRCGSPPHGPARPRPAAYTPATRRCTPSPRASSAARPSDAPTPPPNSA